MSTPTPGGYNKTLALVLAQEIRGTFGIMPGKKMAKRETAEQRHLQLGLTT